MAMPSAAIAGEADFVVTQDFMDVCGKSVASEDELVAVFSQAGWTKAGKDIREAVSPDDFLKKVKNVTAHELTYEDGSGWYGASATGKLGSEKVLYCSVLAIDEDPNGYRQDFETASGLVLKQVADSKMEKRFAVESGADTYVMREIRSPDLSYFVYSKVSPLAVKGK